MIIDTLITDRTQADVEYVKSLTLKWLNGTITNTEKAEWLAGLKGAYNYTDLNRVGEAVAYVANMLNQTGRSVSVIAKQNWTVADIPSTAQMTSFLNDLTLLKNNVDGVTLNTPSTMDNLNYQTANLIEQIILACYNSIIRERADSEICGVAICGVEGVL